MYCRTICQESWPHHEQMYYYSMAMMMLQFAIPLTVLVFTYARIAVAVWGGRPPGEAENSRDERMAKSKRKVRSDIEKVRSRVKKVSLKM